LFIFVLLGWNDSRFFGCESNNYFGAFMDIFTALRDDHDKQRHLMKVLVETEGNSPSRAMFFSDLKDQLEAHAVAEERFFYAPLIADDKSIDLSRHGIAEHHQIDKLVAKLEETEMSSPNWLKTMKELQHKVLHHLEEEEREFFPIAGKVLAKQEKQSLAKDYEAEMAEQ
jgi:hypothetical protein